MILHPTQSRVRGALTAIAATAVAMAVLSPAEAQQPGQSNPSKPSTPTQAQAAEPVQIDRNGVLILIRSTLLALDHANRTGNYTVLRDLGAPGFQAGNNAARLAEIFANLRAQNLDLSGVAVLEPQLTTLPQRDASGLMRMAGFFPSVPVQVNFDLLFAPVDGRWRLFGIALNLGQASPAAPVPPEAQKPEAQKPSETPSAQAGATAKPAPAARPAPRPPAPAPAPSASAPPGNQPARP